MLKKLLLILISLLLVVALAGCSTSNTSETPETETVTESETVDQVEVADSSTILVAYFSATGTTKNVANMITSELGCNEFEITPQQPYTEADLDYNNPDSRVSQEHDNESQRDIPLVQVTPENWENYDVVLLGYPIWWGEAAFPLDVFVIDNDFAGKTVIPFCTSASSGIGSSGDELAALADSGEWLEGMRFSSSTTQDEVNSWLKEIGLIK